MNITFVTGNEQKFKEAQAVCAKYDIAIERQKVTTTEMQTHSIDEVAISKAKQAYTQLRRPVVVNDTGWRVPALNGFPGAFMRYMNEWFAPDDFLRLMDGKTDRSIFLVEVIAYYDGKNIKTFTLDTEGRIVERPRGSGGAPSDKVVSLGVDNGKTIAEMLDDSDGSIAYDGPNIWDAFCQNYTHQTSAKVDQQQTD